MHVCEAHEEMLPDGARPIPMPDTVREARILLSLFEQGTYPADARRMKYGRAGRIGTSDHDHRPQ